MNNRKNRLKRKSKKVYLPLYVSIPYSIILCISIFIAILFAPSAYNAFMEIIYYEFRYMSPAIYIMIFFIAILFAIMIITLMLKMNERLKSKSIKEMKKDDNYSLYGSYDSDRSYLENQISELSNALSSNEERWKNINQLLLSSAEINGKNKGQLGPNDFLKSFGISVDNLELDDKLIFVLNSFHNNYVNDFMNIKEVCKNKGLIVCRGDEELIQGNMLAHILKFIVKSRIIIANLNGRNPNVFYELGIAHMMGKPTILISHVDNELPFDLQNQYVVIYNDENDLKEKLAKILSLMLEDNI